MAWGQEPSQAANPSDIIMVMIDGKETPVIRNSPQGIAMRDAALARHEAAKATLDTAKADEMAARKEAFKWAFGDDARVGVNNIELNNGYVLKGTRKQTTNIVAPVEAIEAAEDKMPTLGNEATFLFERIITWKPEFSTSEYKKLDTGNPTHRAVKAEIDKLIETKDGAPTLEIKAPKGSGK